MRSQKQLRTIGVLGGMGPEATLLFMQRVLAAVDVRDDADHIPLLVDQNPQVPSRIAALIEKKDPDPAPVLKQMAMRLEDAGAAALVMPCNTAHAYAAAIQDAVSIPFLSMMDITAAVIAGKTPRACVGILASPAVKLTGVFEAPLSERGLTPIYSDNQDQLLSAIKRLKCNGTDPNARKTVLAGARTLHSAGADIILIGCSEFSLLGRDIERIAPAIDSLDALVAATVSYSQSGEPGFGRSSKPAHRPGADTPENQTGPLPREAAV
ncbi:MAG: aspartate/glutamate racemase family protein [Roseibium sp.]|nr:aspartate/glutamate racemase family protein [Roseibium sp.]